MPRVCPQSVAISLALLVLAPACDDAKDGDKTAAKEGDAAGSAKDGAAPGDEAPGEETKDGAAAAEGGGAAPGDSADATLPEKIVADAVAKAEQEAGVGAFFDKEFTKRACEYLSADLVAEVFAVPVGEIKTMKIMGCHHTWRADGKIVEARLSMPRVHDSVEDAKSWYANVTASKTKEEMDAQFDVVKGKLDEREELDSKLKRDTAKGLTDIAKMGTPDGGVVYEEVPGIGDEARVSNADGSMWIRVGNSTFQIGAYHGADQPPVPFDAKNPKAIAQAAMEAQKKWLADTYDQRKQDAATLAPRVLKAIAEGS